LRPAFEVADVLKRHWPVVLNDKHFNSWQIRTLGAIMRCRTAALGGHKDICSNCGNSRISYNSCRNRHCPKCQGKNRENWIENRENDLLPVPYFHVVFTLHDILNQLVLFKPKAVYNSLFDAAWNTIKVFANDPKHLGAQTGMIAVLHTWGQNLSLHPHLHCIVPGGGLSDAGFWKYARNNGKYLFPVKAMSMVFRAKYAAALRMKIPDIDKKFMHSLFDQQWVVYAKRPFGNPHQIIEYLGRYTHKIAISNHRILNIDQHCVTFYYKDYRKGAKKLEMTLPIDEFIRRFAMHILPKAFVRIRHYGILSSSTKHLKIPHIKQLLDYLESPFEKYFKTDIFNSNYCPNCKTESMITVEIFHKRGPPDVLKSTINSNHFILS